jgi:hypothetical protein
MWLMEGDANGQQAPRPRMMKPVVSRFRNFAEMEKADRLWWHSLTPVERMQHLEFLRELNYGSQVTERRLPQISQRPRR